MASPILTDSDITAYRKAVLTDDDIKKYRSNPKFLTDDDVTKFRDQSVFKKTFQAVTQPLPKTLSGKAPSEVVEPIAAQQAFQGSPIKSFLTGFGGDIADIATTPLSYVPLPLGIAGKALGKTTLGKVVSKVPLKQLLSGGLKEKAAYQIALENLPSRVAESQAPLQIAPNPVQKIITALEEARPIRAEQEALYSKERKRRAGFVEKVGREGYGEAGFFKQLSALKGELPKAEFTGIRDKISQTDIDSLFQLVQNHGTLSTYEKIAAKKGLLKLIGEEGSIVPNDSEIALLSEVFPQKFIDTVLDKRNMMERFGVNLAEAFNVPRAMMATADLSAPLRQGIFFIGRPSQFLPAFGNMFKYAFSEKAYLGLMDDIKTRPNYQLMRESKLPLTDIGSSLSNREEAFMSRLPEKIPLIGKLVRGSNRAYAGFLNKLRADVFDDLVNKVTLQGLKPDGKLLRDISKFVGAATGRGELPQSLERHAISLNSILFSPRLMASRLNLMNPMFYTSLDPMVRKEALKSLFTMTGTAGTVLGLASLGGAKVGTDIRSADFGKIKVGNTRYDILGGFQQYIRLAGQLITGEHISSTTGVKTTIGEGYKPLTRFDILGRFVESKEAPVLSFATALLRGHGFGGQPLDVPKEVVKRFVPMITQDMWELYKEKGVDAIGMEIPAIFGVGTQTYSPTPSEIVHSSRSVVNYAKKLGKYGRFDEANKLMSDNNQIINMSKSLIPMQERMNFIERQINIVRNKKSITEEHRRESIIELKAKIKSINDSMENTLRKLRE